MAKILQVATLAIIAPSLAFAEPETGPAALIPYPDWILFALALILTAWWSAQAFDRPLITLADTPTYPKYMTRPNLYNFGKALFVAFSVAIYALMVRYHSDLPRILKAVNPDWYGPLKTIIEQKNPSYLIVIVIVSACFLLLLRTEKEWNFYLTFRDMIHAWVSIPYLTNRIVNLIKDTLVVPSDAQSALANSHPEWRVHLPDFSKHPDSMDRAWAELAYLQSWISNQHHISTDTTFFSEESFAWDEINNEFARLLAAVAARKAGFASSAQQSAQLMKDIAVHRRKLGRLIACYLVFMNSTRSGLVETARKLGIDLGPGPCDNPLRYSAIYLVALIMAVYFGVYFSAVSYDLLHGAVLLTSLTDQDTSYVARWVLLAFGDYGIPILGILILRYLMWWMRPVREYSIAVAYAWIFLLTALLSTLGLSLMSELFGKYTHQWGQFLYVCEQETRWAIGPALLCVYINHFLDRQIDPTRPNIEHPSERPWLRMGYALLFALLVVATALPSIPAIQAPAGSPWDVSKLRFVSMGTIFFITMAMTLAAQFALIKSREKHPAATGTPRHPGAELAVT
jgi:hypothetical protein